MSGRTESEYTTFFPEELIKLTEVTVPAKAIVFMGEYIVDLNTGIENVLSYAAFAWN